MPVKGTYTALQKLQPDSTDYAKMIADNERLNFAMDTEKKRREDAQKAAAEAKREKQLAAFGKDLESIKYDVVDNKDLDTPNIVYTQKVAEEVSRMGIEAADNPTIMTPQWRAKYNRLLGMPSFLKNASAAYLQQSTELNKRSLAEKLSKWNANDIAVSGAVLKDNKYALRFNPVTGETIAHTVIRDPNNPGEYITKELDLTGALNGTGISRFIDPLDKDINSKTGQALGQRQQRKSNGIITSSYTQKDSNGLSLEDQIRESSTILFGRELKEDGTIAFDEPSDQAKSYWTDIMDKNEPSDGILTEDQVTQMIEHRVKEVGNYYDTTVSGSSGSGSAGGRKTPGADKTSRYERKDDGSIRVSTIEIGGGKQAGSPFAPQQVRVAKIIFAGGKEISYTKDTDKTVKIQSVSLGENKKLYASKSTTTRPPEHINDTDDAFELWLSAQSKETRDKLTTYETNVELNKEESERVWASPLVTKEEKDGGDNFGNSFQGVEYYSKLAGFDENVSTSNDKQIESKGVGSKYNKT